MLDSVRVRLTLWYSAVLAFALLALAGAIYLLLARNAVQSTDSNLSELADAFLTTVDAELESDTSLPGSLNGKGFSNTQLMTEKMAVFAPMPKARVRTAMAVNPGDLCSMRSEKRMSCARFSRKWTPRASRQSWRT